VKLTVVVFQLTVHLNYWLTEFKRLFQLLLQLRNLTRHQPHHNKSMEQRHTVLNSTDDPSLHLRQLIKIPAWIKHITSAALKYSFMLRFRSHVFNHFQFCSTCSIQHILPASFVHFYAMYCIFNSTTDVLLSKYTNYTTPSSLWRQLLHIALVGCPWSPKISKCNSCIRPNAQATL